MTIDTSGVKWQEKILGTINHLGCWMNQQWSHHCFYGRTPLITKTPIRQHTNASRVVVMGSRDCRHLQGSPDGCLRPLSHARLRTMVGVRDWARVANMMYARGWSNRGWPTDYSPRQDESTRRCLGSTAERFEAVERMNWCFCIMACCKNILPSAREIAVELDWELAPIPDL